MLLYPRERLKRKRNSDLDNYSQLSKKRKNNVEVTFIKQVPIHPHPHPQILAALNDFTPSQILNKTFIFDTLKIDEENIIDRKIDTLKNKITMNIM